MLKHRIKFFFMVLLLPVVALVSIDVYISFFSRSRIFDDVEKIPFNKCGLVLGTSKFLSDGRTNTYFTTRLDAALKLHSSGKIRYVIVSGDNGEKYYNEPLQMKNYLVERGFPAKKIFMDFAGFRTLDSVVRARHIFGQEKITVISQRFHLERAIYLGRKNAMDLVGFAANEVNELSHIRIRLREVLARVKAFIDVHILNKKPRFLGEKILIE